MVFQLEREEKEKLFGPIKPLSFMEHRQIFDETGIDVDGTSRDQAFNFNVDADGHM